MTQQSAIVLDRAIVHLATKGNLNPNFQSDLDVGWQGHPLFGQIPSVSCVQSTLNSWARAESI